MQIDISQVEKYNPVETMGTSFIDIRYHYINLMCSHGAGKNESG